MGWNRLEEAGILWNWLELDGVTINCLKWLELALNGWYGWTFMKLYGNGWKWLGWLELLEIAGNIWK